MENIAYFTLEHPTQTGQQIHIRVVDGDTSIHDATTGFCASQKLTLRPATDEEIQRIEHDEQFRDPDDVVAPLVIPDQLDELRCIARAWSNPLDRDMVFQIILDNPIQCCNVASTMQHLHDTYKGRFFDIPMRNYLSCLNFYAMRELNTQGFL